MGEQRPLAHQMTSPSREKAVACPASNSWRGEQWPPVHQMMSPGGTSNLPGSQHLFCKTRQLGGSLAVGLWLDKQQFAWVPTLFCKTASPIAKLPPNCRVLQNIVGAQANCWLSGNCPTAKLPSNCRVLQNIVGTQANSWLSGNYPTAKLGPNCQVLQNIVGTQANCWLSGNCPTAKLPPQLWSLTK